MPEYAEDVDFYRAYLRSPQWAATKERYRRSKAPKQCLVCGSKRYELHHRTYVRLGKEHIGDLRPLCRKHHEELHRLRLPGERIEDATDRYLADRRQKPKKLSTKQRHKRNAARKRVRRAAGQADRERNKKVRPKRK